MEIRSYRRVFDLERRIYRIDRLRLNPSGVPLRGILYCLVLVALTLAISSLPVIGAAVKAMPWYMRDLGLPGASAAVLTMIRIEGRPAHLTLRSLLGFACGPRHVVGARACRSSECFSSGQRWYPPPLLCIPDGSDARLRRLRYSGPGAVLVTVAHQRAEWRVGAVGRLLGRDEMTIDELPGGGSLAKGQVIALRRGARLGVR
ncbi:MAG: hypothetical protein WB998_04430 [Solirubrobacteraceae bacterium]